jgi:hypothetical protein
MNKIQKSAYIAAMVAVVGLSVGFVTHAFSGSSSGVVIENVQTLNLNLPTGQLKLGSEEIAIEEGDTLGVAVATADLVVNKQNFKNGFQVNGTNVMSSARALTNLTGINALETSTNLTATTTITAAQSGNTFYVSGGKSTWTLPATSSAVIGATYRFVVGGALTVTSSVVTASGIDGIEGTLIVAGAVVDCDAEDQIIFGAAFENIGDYVEFRFSGTYWMLGDSGALTASAISCTKT